MEVYIFIEIDDIHRVKIFNNDLSAYFTIVAVGENNKLKEVPRLELNDEEEITEFKKGIERYEKRKLKRSLTNYNRYVIMYLKLVIKYN